MLNSCCAPDGEIDEGGRDGSDFDLKQPGLHRGLNGSGCCRPLMYFLFHRLGSLYDTLGQWTARPANQVELGRKLMRQILNCLIN